MIDVLLIAPSAPSLYTEEAFSVSENMAPPLGLCYLASCLKDAGFSVAIEDFHIERKDPSAVVALVEKLQPTIVGISATTPAFPAATMIARNVREASPGVRVVLGGMHGTFCYPEALASGCFDVVVIGEGEVTLVEYARHVIHRAMRLQDIRGIAFSDDSRELVKTAPRTPIENLDLVPFPSKDLLKIERYDQKGAMITSRGCTANCVFCACAAFAGRHFRFRSPENVVDEIAHHIDRWDVRQFEFHDDAFTLNKERAMRICDLIIKRCPSIEWGCQSRVTGFDQRMAESLCEAGCKCVQFGVESGNEEVLDSIGKGITLSEAQAAVIAARKAGIPNIIASFIIGHPNDTRETVNDTVDFAKRLIDHGATGTPISVLTPFPGTSVYHRAAQMGIIIENLDWEDYVLSRANISTRHLSRDDLRRSYFEALFEILEHQGYVAEESVLPAV